MYRLDKNSGEKYNLLLPELFFPLLCCLHLVSMVTQILLVVPLLLSCKEGLGRRRSQQRAAEADTAAGREISSQDALRFHKAFLPSRSD